MPKADHLGEFEQLVLLAVLRLGANAYGAKIQEVLEEIGGRGASISSIYITLTRLEAKGMVSSWMGEPTEERGGKARRYFAVERAGLTGLNESRSRLMAMWDGLEGVLDRAGRAVRGG